MIRAGQLWECRDARRPGTHRVLWASDNGRHARVIRCDVGRLGRWVRGDRFESRYRLVQAAPVKVAPPSTLGVAA